MEGSPTFLMEWKDGEVNVVCVVWPLCHCASLKDVYSFPGNPANRSGAVRSRNMVAILERTDVAFCRALNVRQT